MNRFANSVSGVALGVLVTLAAGSVAASAQDLASSGQAARSAPAEQGGPLRLQPVDSGFVFTPEVKFTPVNHSTGTMVGGYGGWLLEDQFLLGGAAYWLVDGASGTDMWYGGVISGWTVPMGKALRLGGRALVGWGYAEMPYEFTYAPYGHHPGGTRMDWVSTSFFVFEPQATAAIRLSRVVSVDVAGGYRVIADAGGLDRELRGGFGSVGIRFGPF